jgi:hypothetical protein
MRSSTLVGIAGEDVMPQSMPDIRDDEPRENHESNLHHFQIFEKLS